MRLIMMIVGALLVLGGGAAGAYFYFGKQAEAAAPKGDDYAPKKEKHAKKEKKKGGDDHGDGYGGGAAYVEIAPLILPIVDNNGVSQVVSMVLSLEVGGSGDVDRVKAMEPKLKDAYIQDMYGLLNEHAALKGGVIQVGYIKKRLNRVSAEVMGDDVVKEVLLQAVQQRPI